MTTSDAVGEPTPDDQAMALARQRHGLITYVEAIRCGFTHSSIDRRVRSRRWTRIHPQVYVIGAAPDTLEQRLLGRLLSFGDDACVSHRAAANLWGLPGYGPCVEWSRPRGRSQRRPYGMGHGSMWLPAGHVQLFGAIPVTTVPRTLFDLAGVDHPKRVEVAFDRAVTGGLCTTSQVQRVFDDLARRGRRGTAAMRLLLDDRCTEKVEPNSRLEMLARKVLSGAGIDDFEVEVDLGGHDEWIGRVDLLFADARLVVELDSRTFHSSRFDRERDRRRDNDLMARGFRVLRVTWDDLVHRSEEVVAQVLPALGRKGVSGRPAA